MGRVCMVEAHYQQYIDRGLATQGVVETRGCGACVYGGGTLSAVH